MSDDQQPSNEFMTQAQSARTGFARELLELLKNNKKWWLAPILVSIILLGVLVLLSGTAAAPFIYTLF